MSFPNDLIWKNITGEGDPLPPPHGQKHDSILSGYMSEGQQQIGDLSQFMNDNIQKNVWEEQFNKEPGCYCGTSISEPTMKYYFVVGPADPKLPQFDTMDRVEQVTTSGNFGACSFELAKTEAMQEEVNKKMESLQIGEDNEERDMCRPPPRRYRHKWFTQFKSGTVQNFIDPVEQNIWTKASRFFFSSEKEGKSWEQVIWIKPGMLQRCPYCDHPQEQDQDSDDEKEDWITPKFVLSDRKRNCQECFGSDSEDEEDEEENEDDEGKDEED